MLHLTPLRHIALNPGARFRLSILREAHADWLAPSRAHDYQEEIGVTPSDARDWCGDWAGAMGLRAGLHPDIARHVMPSTYRLATDQEGEPGWDMVDHDPPDPVPIADIQPGDVATVETTRGREWGDHIVIVAMVLADSVITYEGNTTSGIVAETLSRPSSRSVCRCERALADVRHVHRLGWQHRRAA